MVEEHSESAGNPFYCQKCNVYLKVSYIGNYILIPINCKLNIKKNVTFNSKFNFYFFFQSESAFKSHNSKLHLERREKTYYCRECDETFTCLVKHSLHIVVHRTWTQEGKKESNFTKFLVFIKDFINNYIFQKWECNAAYVEKCLQGTKLYHSIAI